MLREHQLRWGVDQWAAYLSGQVFPCMPRSKAMLTALEEAEGEALAARELADIAGTDPFLCLRLLREAEAHRTRRLGHDTTTPLAAVMLLGSDTFRELLVSSPETDEGNPGLVRCEARAHLAARLARQWGTARSDVSPDEVAMAALLEEIGELLLWTFAPDLPAAAEAELASGRAQRSVQAQVQVCGFAFRQLTLKCAIIWNLPPLLVQLIRGVDNVRANLSRLCVDTARHLVSGPENPALPSDLVEAKRLIPSASLRWLVEHMPGIDAEHAEALVAATEPLLGAAENPSAD